MLTCEEVRAWSEARRSAELAAREARLRDPQHAEDLLDAVADLAVLAVAQARRPEYAALVAQADQLLAEVRDLRRDLAEEAQA